MRTLALTMLAVAASCSDPGARPRPTPIVPHAARSHAQRLQTRTPDADPVEFRGRSRELDVDHDGRLDLVLTFAERSAIAELHTELAALAPAIVAHRLAHGRYAIDDDVTRASLRAFCPESPQAVRDAPRSREPMTGVAELFRDGVCARAWGADLDAAERIVRARADASGGALPAAMLTALLETLRALPMPLTLSSLRAAPLRIARASERPEPPVTARASDPGCAAVDRANVSVVDTCGMNGMAHDGPRLLAHARPDGSFSTADDTARAWAMRECANVTVAAQVVDVIDVACARLHGRGAEDVVAALATVLRADGSPIRDTRDDDLCLTFQELASVAVVETPFAPLSASGSPLLPVDGR